MKLPVFRSSDGTKNMKRGRYQLNRFRLSQRCGHVSTKVYFRILFKQLSKTGPALLKELVELKLFDHESTEEYLNDHDFTQSKRKSVLKLDSEIIVFGWYYYMNITPGNRNSRLLYIPSMHTFYSWKKIFFGQVKSERKVLDAYKQNTNADEQ